MLIRKYVCPIQLQLSWSLVRLKSCSWNGTSLSSFPWHRKMDSNLLSSWQRCLKWPARLGPCFSLPSLPVLLPSFETPHLLSAGPTVEVSTLGFQSVKSCGLKMPFFFFFIQTELFNWTDFYIHHDPMETDSGERDLVPVDWELIFVFFLLVNKKRNNLPWKNHLLTHYSLENDLCTKA